MIKILVASFIVLGCGSVAYVRNHRPHKRPMMMPREVLAPATGKRIESKSPALILAGSKAC